MADLGHVGGTRRDTYRAHRDVSSFFVIDGHDDVTAGGGYRDSLLNDQLGPARRHPPQPERRRPTSLNRAI